MEKQPRDMVKKMVDNYKSGQYVALLVVLVCLLAYMPALSCGFVTIDDPEYVLTNPLIRQLDWKLLVSSFTRSHVGWWMPLTWISFALDYHFWALDPLGYHLTNIVLHAFNAGLVVLIADRLCRDRFVVAATGAEPGYMYPGFLLLAGLFFGVHPLRVESVAWVAERKDVLNGFFSFGAILFYLRYVQKKSAIPKVEGAGREYLLALVFFFMSLMAKSVSVVLPVMLVVLDWYPLGRLRRDNLLQVLREKAPFLAASALVAASTLLFAARSSYLVTYEAFPFSQRLAVSGNALWEYCRLLVFPAGLSPFNVIPDPIPVAYTVKALLVALAFIVIILSRRVPWILSCWLCFLLPVFPVLAFFQNGDQAFADRFTYFPSVAPSIVAAALVAGFVRTRQGRAGRLMALLVPVLLIGLILVATLHLLPVWQTTETFWTRVIEIQPIAINYKERGRYYQSRGRFDAAVADFTSALSTVSATLKPYEYNLYAFRGESLRSAGRHEEAVRDFTSALKGLPHPVYFYRRGLALSALGRKEEADEDFRRSGPDPGPVNWFDKEP